MGRVCVRFVVHAGLSLPVGQRSRLSATVGAAATDASVSSVGGRIAQGFLRCFIPGCFPQDGVGERFEVAFSLRSRALPSGGVDLQAASVRDREAREALLQLGAAEFLVFSVAVSSGVALFVFPVGVLSPIFALVGFAPLRSVAGVFWPRFFCFERRTMARRSGLVLNIPSGLGAGAADLARRGGSVTPRRAAQLPFSPRRRVARVRAGAALARIVPASPVRVDLFFPSFREKANSAPPSRVLFAFSPGCRARRVSAARSGAMQPAQRAGRHHGVKRWAMVFFERGRRSSRTAGLRWMARAAERRSRRRPSPASEASGKGDGRLATTRARFPAARRARLPRTDQVGP